MSSTETKAQIKYSEYLPGTSWLGYTFSIESALEPR